jgi:hypothetical protein
MFVPFFSTKEVGMGLAMVHGMVHEHIQVESRPGGGTSLRIWFPVWFAETLDDPAGQAPAWSVCKDTAITALDTTQLKLHTT